MYSEGTYSTGIAYLLWFLSGFGVLGFHRFYLNKIGTGILWALTGGLGLVGAVYDFFTLPAQVRDANLRNRYMVSLAGAGYDTGLTRDSAALEEALRKLKTDRQGQESIERIILRTAKKNRGLATASEVALEGNIPIEKAKKYLEKLALDGHAELKITNEGVIVYLFPEFRAFGSGNEAGGPEFEDLGR
ncbi:MAG: TM2 domain-containing protein [Spirochaetales bacterium]|nr:MAG: TM2 domain-containing protein [Spirochaetales bacterium]